jgi:hypothetical protein
LVSPCWELTRLQEDGEAKIDGLERGVLVREEEVLRLEVAVDHSVLVAELHDWSRRPYPREATVMADERDIPWEDMELLSTSQEQTNQSENTQTGAENREDSWPPS